MSLLGQEIEKPDYRVGLNRPDMTTRTALDVSTQLAHGKCALHATGRFVSSPIRFQEQINSQIEELIDSFRCEFLSGRALCRKIHIWDAVGNRTQLDYLPSFAWLLPAKQTLLGGGMLMVRTSLRTHYVERHCADS